MNMPSKSAPANAHPARCREIVSNTCCFSRIMQGALEVARPDCRCPVAQRQMPRKCFTNLCYDPYTRCYRVSDGRCPSKFNYRPTIPECIPADGTYCSKPCCISKPKPPCPDPRSCEDLFASVAAAQRALSQILGAEAEKLKRIIASTDDLDKLLEVNQAVNRTLTDVTFLEQALFHELEQIREICGPCRPEPEDACRD